MKKIILFILFGFAIQYSKSQVYIKDKNINADSSGKKVKFHSPIDLLNHITNNGWKLLRRDIVTTANGPYAFILFERL